MVPTCPTVEELTAPAARRSLTLVCHSVQHPEPEPRKSTVSSTDGPSPSPSDNLTRDPNALFLRSPTKSSPMRLAGNRSRTGVYNASKSTPSRSRPGVAQRVSDAAHISYKRLTSPDRFLPTRPSEPIVEECFRLSKDPRTLSPKERARRQREPDYDPFGTTNTIRRLTWPNRALGRNQTPTARPPSWRVGPSLLDLESDSEQEIINSTSQQRDRKGHKNIVTWSVTRTNPSTAVADGQGHLLGSGTTAPMHNARFAVRSTSGLQLQTHQSRVAFALDIDLASRVLQTADYASPASSHGSPKSPSRQPSSPIWNNCTWVRDEHVMSGVTTLSFPSAVLFSFGSAYAKLNTVPKQKSCMPHRAIPSIPFRVLDAPLLRDDYYCSTLAYSNVAGLLAVGLGTNVYLWSADSGVQRAPLPPTEASNYVTSLSFSSYRGRRSILAIGRYSGQVSLWSTYDSKIRLEKSLPHPVSCVAFRDGVTHRHSKGLPGTLVDTEDLAVGDEAGNIRYYSVEWPHRKSLESSAWQGSMTLLAEIAAHTQQICGMTWSLDGTYLATGGNDNSCLLFDVAEILRVETRRVCAGPHSRPSTKAVIQTSTSSRPVRSYSYPSWAFAQRQDRGNDWELASDEALRGSVSTSANHSQRLIRSRSLREKPRRFRRIPPGSEKHRFRHAAAVKALAFAPWQPALLATGGGSNDQCIRFFHAPSGSCLATIRVYAQVTSLIWSKTRREIAATFGYAQPPHPFRIAVFAWPSCEQVVAIPWTFGNDTEYSEIGRALWAISYPGAPNGMAHDEEDVDTTQRRSLAAPSVPPNTISPRASATPAPRHGSGERLHNTGQGASSRPHRRLSYREGGRWWPRTAEEGCIVVACSNECVKFHEVWSGEPKTVIAATQGVLGGSDILESLEGIEKEGNEIIR